MISLADIAVLKEHMKKDYETICEAAPEFSAYSLEEFMKVRCLVNSRIFRIKQKGVLYDALVPVAGSLGWLNLTADMFNYKYGSNMTYWEYDETTNEFIVTATEDINRGQEVGLFYCRSP
jgi:hypothetical protein